ncbi:MAG: hypothetical protein RBT61_10770 [Candidatus Kapabacteria bacterium]|jgi:hypothetical protein|nr:hypothetical protein [Candidatus Kapabacteria bacterium]
MNTNFDFVREYRTPNSEVYSIFIDEHEDVDGRLDLHFLPDGSVTGLLSLYKEFSDDDVTVVLAAIDDKIVDMADIEAGNFFIEVYTVTNRRGFGINPAEG